MKTAETPAAMANGDLINKLLRMLSLTEERELTCAEVFELIDYYTELEQSGQNVSVLMPTVWQHLRICPECAEEFEALKEMIAANSGEEGDL